MTETEGLWPLCETCGAVPTSHKDYRDCEAHMQVVAHAYNGGRENGGKEERAAVVAWLSRVEKDCVDISIWTRQIRDAVKNGEHQKEHIAVED